VNVQTQGDQHAYDVIRLGQRQEARDTAANDYATLKFGEEPQYDIIQPSA